MAVIGFRKSAKRTSADPDGTKPHLWDQVSDVQGIYPDDYVPTSVGTRTSFYFIKVPDEAVPDDGGFTEQDRVDLLEPVTKIEIVDQLPVEQTLARRKRKIDPKTFIKDETIAQATRDAIVLAMADAPYDYATNGVPEVTRAVMMKHFSIKTIPQISVI